MIRRLLERLEKNPHALFTEREVRLDDTEQFIRIRDEGLIHRVSADAGSTVYSGRLLTACTNPDGTLEALDDEDVEFDPVEASAASGVRWRLDLAAFAARFREGNSLSGVPGPLDTRLYLLGETLPVEAIVLALLADGPSGLPILRSLPVLAPSAYERFVVLTASLPIPSREFRGLESLGIFLAQLSAAAPFALPSAVTRRVGRSNASGRMTRASERQSDSQRRLTYSPDYSTVVANGKTWNFVGAQARAIGVFIKQLETGVPELNQQYVLTEIESDAKRLRDLFKNSPAWGTLLVPGDRPGFYRLGLD